MEFLKSVLHCFFSMFTDPPAFFHRTIRNAWKSIALPKSQCEGHLPISSPSSVIRIRSLSLIQNHDSDRLPLYGNATEIVKLEYLPRNRFTLSKTVVSLTFQAAFAMFPAKSSFQGQPLVGAAIVIAFAASFSVMFIMNSYPRVAAIVEKIGFLSLAIVFFAITHEFFSGSLIMWITEGLIWSLTMLAFLIGCLT